MSSAYMRNSTKNVVKLMALVITTPTSIPKEKLPEFKEKRATDVIVLSN